MVSPETFDRDDLAFAKKRSCDSIGASAVGIVCDPLRRKTIGAAGGAGHGLRMKATIRGIVIFGVAVRIQRPRCMVVYPVIGQREHNAVARTAVRAIDVGIAVARIARIETFPRQSSQTGRSGETRTVGRSVRWLSRIVNPVSPSQAPALLHIRDAGRRRRLALHLADKGLHSWSSPSR